MNKNMTRREFLKVSAKSFLAPLVLTACGNLISLTGCAAPKAGEVTVDSTNLITDLATLQDAKAFNFTFAGKKSILLYNDGKIKAFENICTHEAGPTKLTGPKLVCQWHGATFDPLTGEATGRPAPSGSKLPEIPLEIKGEKIYVVRKKQAGLRKSISDNWLAKKLGKVRVCLVFEDDNHWNRFLDFPTAFQSA